MTPQELNTLLTTHLGVPVNVWRAAMLTGSRFVCNPPIQDTDFDIVLYVENTERNDIVQLLVGEGWVVGGSHRPSSNGAFASVKKTIDGVLYNLIIVDDGIAFNRWQAATHLCKKLNLLDKNDRIAIFSAVWGEVPSHIDNTIYYNELFGSAASEQNWPVDNPELAVRPFGQSVEFANVFDSPAVRIRRWPVNDDIAVATTETEPELTPVRVNGSTSNVWIDEEMVVNGDSPTTVSDQAEERLRAYCTADQPQRETVQQGVSSAAEQSWGVLSP